MKLLLDENISDRIVPQIVDLFPGSTHVKTVGLDEADDSVVWAWSKQHEFTMVPRTRISTRESSSSALLPSSFGCELEIVRRA